MWLESRKEGLDPLLFLDLLSFPPGGNHKANWVENPQFTLVPVPPLWLSRLAENQTEQAQDNACTPSSTKVALSGNVTTWVGCFPAFLPRNLEAGSYPYTKNSSELHRAIVHGQCLPRLAGPSHCICQGQ